MIKTTVTLDEALYLRARHYAIEQRVSFQEVMREALRRYLPAQVVVRVVDPSRTTGRWLGSRGPGLAAGRAPWVPGHS